MGKEAGFKLEEVKKVYERMGDFVSAILKAGGTWNDIQRLIECQPACERAIKMSRTWASDAILAIFRRYDRRKIEVTAKPEKLYCREAMKRHNSSWDSGGTPKITSDQFHSQSYKGNCVAFEIENKSAPKNPFLLVIMVGSLAENETGSFTFDLYNPYSEIIYQCETCGPYKDGLIDIVLLKIHEHELEHTKQ